MLGNDAAEEDEPPKSGLLERLIRHSATHTTGKRRCAVGRGTHEPHGFCGRCLDEQRRRPHAGGL